MNELSIEEKAERYDEAIKIAKSKIKNDKDHVLYEDDILDIFSELKESGDARIRKDIIWCFKHSGIKEGNPINPHVTTTIKDAIAWLEKQIEQKTTAWTPMDEQHVENLLAIIEGHGYPGEVAWLNSLKDRVQSKQGWSEEDESNLDSAIYYIRREPYLESNIEPIVYWLRNLKDRLQLK